MAAKPQFDWQDLLDWTAKVSGRNPSRKPVSPVTAQGLDVNRRAAELWGAVYDPKNFGKKGNVLNAVYDYGTPAGLYLTSEEVRRLGTKGPDKGHLASIAFGAALLGAMKRVGKGIKGGIQGYREFQRLLESKGMPAPRSTPVRGAGNDFVNKQRTFRS